ncbi:MAG: YebC/PmpR family DNA-binding transcriptional regulator [Gammaproteobacteria bacterium]|nr:YebC/PmpR family DNA-binding transcriptional regulator [Gammaproteobacteria bacterium]
MAGHSKWANIKHRKARQDAKRAKIWTKVIREITVAARLGGGSIEDNPRLRLAVDNALTSNMPRDTIERAIERGAGGGEGSTVEEVSYEGYGPGGVAIFVETMTDNRNRTVASIRHLFSKHNGNLGTDGSVAYLFDKRGIIQVEHCDDEDALLEIALDSGAEDVENDDEGATTILTLVEDFTSVINALRDAEIQLTSSEIAMIPNTSVPCDEDTTEKVQTLLEAFEDLDDVQNVYSNGEFTFSPDSS